MKELYTTLLLGVFIILTACGGATVMPDTLPEILYGEDVCDQCNMIISDERFAAGLVVELEPGGFEHRIFDDIGELFEYEKANRDELTIATYYVHDYNSKEWLDGETAYYIHSENIRSPMGFSLAAAAQKLEAKALAQEWNGSVLTFTELHERFVGGAETANHDHHDGQ